MEVCLPGVQMNGDPGGGGSLRVEGLTLEEGVEQNRWRAGQ